VRMRTREEIFFEEEETVNNNNNNNKNVCVRYIVQTTGCS